MYLNCHFSSLHECDILSSESKTIKLSAPNMKTTPGNSLCFRSLKT